MTEIIYKDTPIEIRTSIQGATGQLKGKVTKNSKSMPYAVIVQEEGEQYQDILQNVKSSIGKTIHQIL